VTERELLDRAIARSLFATLPKESVAALLQPGHLLTLPARAIGTPSIYSEYAGLILDGLVRVFVTAPGGREATMGYRRPGDVLVPLHEQLPPLRLQALTPCRLWVVRSAAFSEWLAGDAQCAAAVARYAGKLLYTTMEEFRFSAFAPVRQRVARHLLDLATATATNPSAPLLAPVSVRDLADAVGSVREVVSRDVRHYLSRGVLSRVRDGYCVLRPDVLRADADAGYATS
jgi:CRP/FNR family transcriptional regulator